MKTLLVPFGLKDERLYEPSQVPNGKACGCVCPACKHPLIAKQGASTPHFAHAQDENCSKALETAVHLAAKQLIAEKLELRLPILQWNNVLNQHKTEVISDQFIAKLQSVTLEQWLGDIRPDIVVSTNNTNYLVEIAVTHFVDDEKRLKIQQKNIPTIEIDLSRLKGKFTFENLEVALFTEKFYSAWWIFHPTINKLVAEAEKKHSEKIALWAKVEAEVQAKEEHEKLESERIRREKFYQYKQLSPSKKLEINLKSIGLTEAQMKKLSVFVPWDKSFSCPRIVWQSAVLAYIKKSDDDVWIDGLPCTILSNDCLDWLKDTFEVKAPVENGDSIALWKYLKHLESVKMLKYGGGKEFDLVIRSRQWSKVIS